MIFIIAFFAADETREKKKSTKNFISRYTLHRGSLLQNRYEQDTFNTFAKDNIWFLAKQRFTQWRRNLSYKRNIIEGKRDNKNVLPPKRR